MRHRVALKEAETGTNGEFVYTIHRDDPEQLHVYRHGREIEHRPTLVLLDHPNSDRVEQQNPNGRPSLTRMPPDEVTSLPQANR